MTITASTLYSTLASQASNSTSRQSVAAPAATRRPSIADTATVSQAAQSALAAATGSTSPQPAGTSSGLGSVTGTSGTTYDFTNMTNSQAIAAAKTLASEGKISADAESQIYMTASGWNTICINPTTHDVDPVAQSKWIADHLSSTTPSNFEDTFNGYIAYDNSYDNTKQAARDTEVLQDMQKYSSNAGAVSAIPAATGGILSTTA